MSPIALTGLIIGVTVILFVWNRIPVVIVAMGVAVALWATGVLSLPQAMAGLGDPAVVFIAALFIVSAGLERTEAANLAKIYVSPDPVVWGQRNAFRGMRALHPREVVHA